MKMPIGSLNVIQCLNDGNIGSPRSFAARDDGIEVCAAKNIVIANASGVKQPG